jgi:hypothetical protein
MSNEEDNKTSVTIEQLHTIGRLVIEVLQGAASQGIEEISIGDLMRTFAFTDEEAEPWDEAILVFIKTEVEGNENPFTVH